MLLKSKQQNSENNEIVNRFFETVTIQKIIPKFLTKTFSTFLQGFIGLILVNSSDIIIININIIIKF